MRLSSAGYGAMTEALCELGRPTVFLLEGGYHPDGLTRSVRQTLLAASGIPSAEGRKMWAQPATPRPVVERRLEEALARFAEHWPPLAEASGGRGDARKGHPETSG
jgi:acetoin utilization deacetylase AcuC-like enzyme